MDIILEVFDTYILDRLYATFLPLPSVQVVKDHGHTQNGTLLASQVIQSWTYKPSSEYLQLEPSPFAYQSQWSRDNIYRQALSLFVMPIIFGYISYFATTLTAWFFTFDRSALLSPHYRKNQIRSEITESLISVPFLSVLHLPIFLLEIRGYSKLYDPATDSPGLWYEVLQIPFFVLFVEGTYYFVHRALHSRLLYRHMHKQHHKFVVATPFAGFAFHPVDGFLQGSPYTAFVFLFPLNKWVFAAFYSFINAWTTLIHDGEYNVGSKFLQGSAAHTVHHQRLVRNFGHLFTIMDRLMGTYVNPEEEGAVVRKGKEQATITEVKKAQ